MVSHIYVLNRKTKTENDRSYSNQSDIPVAPDNITRVTIDNGRPLSTAADRSESNMSYGRVIGIRP